MRVLLCDDSALARKTALRCLPEEWRASAQMAANGEEALALLRQQPFDLLLLDLTMPVLDGIGVLQAIKTENLEVFVVVISGDVQPQMQARVMQLGALGFIKKPSKAEELEKILRMYGLF